MAILPDSPFPGDVQADAVVFGPREQALATLNEVRKHAADLVARANLRIELEDASNLDGLKEVEQRFEATRTANAKSYAADAGIGKQWLQVDDSEARRLIDIRAAELIREREIGRLDGWLDGLRESALHVSDPETTRLIDTGANLIGRARAAGVFDAATAKIKQQQWVRSYATAWIEKRPPEERLALLGESASQTDLIEAADDVPNAAMHGTGTPADFVPADDRDRIRREAQAEMDINKAQRLWQRSQHHSQSIEQALQGAAAPPPRTTIDADPDLDESTRTRLLRKHAEMERDLAAYTQFKARFDNSDGGAFNTDNAAVQDFTDKTYRLFGATPAALHAVVHRTGILPASALVRMQGDVASDNPARVMQAVDLAVRLRRDHPRLLALEDSSEDLQNAVSQFQHDTVRGATPDQAIQRIIRLQSSDHQDAWAAQRKSIDLDAEVANATSPNDLAHLPRTDPLVTAVALSVYPQLVKERFAATGDLALAKAQARDQLDLLARAADEDGGAGDGGGEGGGDNRGRRRKLKRAAGRGAETLPPITVYMDGSKPPPSDAPSGNGEPNDPPASHETLAPASENVEAPRDEPALGELEELGTQPTPASDRLGSESLAPEQPAPPPSPPAQAAPALADVEPPARTQPEPQPGPPIVSLEDREKFSAADAEFRGTIQGAAKLNQWATTKQWLEANPNATDEQLLAKFTPALLRTRWAERRQAMVDYLRDAPRLYGEARANLDRYDAMPSARTAAEFVASLRGELYVAATSPETLIGGGGVKGATWLLRALKTALREAGKTAITDSIVQWQNIEAGVQEKFDGWRTAMSAGLSGVLGGLSNAGTDALRLGIKAKSGPPGGKARAVNDPTVSDPNGKKPLTAKERTADLNRRVAEIEKMAAEKPASEKYKGTTLGEADHNDYARTFHQTNKGLEDKVEVHHAVEQRIEKLYPGLFTKAQLNSLENLRGVPRDETGSALHRSVIRKEWDAFYARHHNRRPTQQEVLDHATTIDRKYGGLFDPPL